MTRRPDEVVELEGGWREEITYRDRLALRGERSAIHRLKGPDGRTQRVWHEVVARDGAILHRHDVE